MISRQQQALGGRVPEGERPVAKQPVNTFSSLALVALENEAAVGSFSGLRSRQTQEPAQLVPIVNPRGGR